MLKIIIEDLEISRNYKNDRQTDFNVYCKTWIHINDSNNKIHRSPLFFILDERGAVVVRKDKTSTMVNLILSFPVISKRYSISVDVVNDNNVETLEAFSGVRLTAKTISDVKNQIEDFTEYLQVLIYV